MPDKKEVLVPKDLLSKRRFQWFLEHPGIKAKIDFAWQKERKEAEKVEILFTIKTLLRRFLRSVKRDREVSAARKNLTAQIVAASLIRNVAEFPEGVRVDRRESFVLPYEQLLAAIPKRDLAKVANQAWEFDLERLLPYIEEKPDLAAKVAVLVEVKVGSSVMPPDKLPEEEKTRPRAKVAVH